MPVYPDGTFIKENEWNRLISSTPSSYTIYKDGTTYRAECNSAGGVDYSGTDARTVIQAAIDALPIEGGVIHVKAGTYELNASLLFTGHETLTFEGEGWGIETGNTLFTYTPTDGSHAFRFDDQWGIQLRNFRLNGNVNAGRGIEILDTTGSPNFFTMENVQVTNFGGNQLYVNTLWGSTFKTCLFEAPTGGADNVVYLDDVPYELSFWNCFFRKIPAAKYGLYINEGVSINLRTCEFSAVDISGSYGLGLSGGRAITVDTCEFERLTTGKAIRIGRFGAADLPGYGNTVEIISPYFTQVPTGVEVGDLYHADCCVRIVNPCEAPSYPLTTLATKTVGKGHVEVIPYLRWAAKLSGTDIQSANSGTATIGNGTETTGNIAHGLTGAPTAVFAFGSTTDTEDLYCDSKDATNIVIKCVGAVGGDRTIYWQAEYKP